MKPQEFLRENEFIGDDAHQMHKSHQLHMLREECYHSAANAIKLHKLLGELPEGHDLDAWAAEKISLANDYLKTVAEWLEYDVMSSERPSAGGMTAFNIAEAEEKFAKLLNELAPPEDHNWDDGELDDDPVGRAAYRAAMTIKAWRMDRTTAINTLASYPQLTQQLRVLEPAILTDKTELKELLNWAVTQSRMSDESMMDIGNDPMMNPPANQGKGVAEERTETKNDQGEVTGWQDEGPWKKSTAKKNPRGQVTNLSDRARRETEKLNKQPTVAEVTGDKPFDKMLKGITSKTAVTRQQKADRRAEKADNQARAKNAFGNMFGGDDPVGNLKIREQGVAENTLDQDLDKIAENFSSSISTVFKPGSGPKTGSLFGGSYKNPNSPFAEKKRSSKKSSVIKR